MAKRLTGTNKWDDPWFCGLSCKEKLFWIYILDKCDYSGIWQVHWPLVAFHIPDFVYKPENFKDRITEISPSKWFIPKFIGFQYLTLNPGNKAHASVIRNLQKEGVFKGLGSPLDEAKDKDKDKDVDVREGSRGGKKFVPPTPQEVQAYAASINFDLDGEKFCSHYEASGWMRGKTKITNWKACVRTWKERIVSPANKSEVPAWMK